MDIANLAFGVDFSQTTNAAQALDQLKQRSQDVTAAQQQLTQSNDLLVTSMSNTGQGAARLSRQLADVSSTLETLTLKARAARDAFDGTTATFKAWDEAQEKVEALGRAYGTTARGLDAYLQTAQALNMSQVQAAASVQRLTSALENQTSAAANLRQVLANNGVSIGDLQVDQVDTLLMRVKDAFQKRPDSAQRTRDLQQVLGTFDPDVLGQFTQPNYIPINQRVQRERQSAISVDIARQDAGTLERSQARDLRLQRLDDLNDTYAGYDRSGLSSYLPWEGHAASSADMAVLRRIADPDSTFAREGPKSQAGLLSAYETAQGVKMPDAGPDGFYDFSKLSPEQAAAARMLHRERPLWQYIPGAEGYMRYLGSGKVSANRREIDDRYDEDMENASGFGDRVGAVWNMIARKGANLVEGYTPRAREGLFSPHSVFDDAGAGAGLAGLGNDGLERFQGAQRQLSLLGIYQGLSTDAGGRPTDSLEAARGRGAAALKQFTDVFGSADGQQDYDASITRYAGAARLALKPGQDFVDDADVNLGLQQMSPGDRAKARAFINYAQSRGLRMDTLKGRSLADMLDPSKGAQFGLNAGVTSGFNSGYAARSRTSNLQNQEEFDTFMSDQQDLRTGLGVNGTAGQDMVTWQQAYRKATAETSDELERVKRAEEAVQKAQAERTTQIKETIAALEQQNKAGDKFNDTLGGFATGGAARDMAGLIAGIQQQVDQMRYEKGDAFSQADQDRFVAGKQRALGIDATKQGDAIEANANQEYDNQRRLFQVAGDRQSVQEKMNRDIQVEAQYQKALAEAMASNDQARIDKINAQIERTKQLKDAVAELNLESKAFALGRDATQNANDARYLAGLSPEARVRARRDLDIDHLQGESGAGPGSSGPAIASPFRGNNPTNLSVGSFEATGVVGAYGSNGRFASYRSLEDGVASALNQMIHDIEAHGADTIAKEIGRRSPPGENDTAGMIRDISKWTGIGANDKLDLRDPNVAFSFLGAVTRRETGKQLDPATLQRGIDRSIIGPGGGAPITVEGTSPYQDVRQRREEEAEAQSKLRIQELGEQGTLAQRRAGAQAPFVRSGQTAAATLAGLGVVDPGDARGAAVAAADARMKQVQAELEWKRVADQNTATAAQQADSNTRLADAYKQGEGAVQDLQDRMKVEQEQRQLGNKAINEEVRLRELLKDRIASQAAAVAAETASAKLSNDRQERVNGLGMFASERDVGRLQAKMDIEENARRNSKAPQSELDDYAAQRNRTQTLREQTDQVQAYRDAWNEAGSATTSAFNSMILNGGRARDVISSLAKTLEGIALQFVEKQGGQFLTQLLGGLGGLGGAGSVATAGTSAGVANSVGSVAASLVATGGVFSGGGRMRAYASGGLIDRPTYFATGGEVNLAGEMGTEAIMPLRRMPNGDLGVSTGGGGGRGAVTVNAPITVQGVSGGDGKNGGMSREQLSSLQNQLSEQVRQAVVAGIADEKRAGGSLYY